MVTLLFTSLAMCSTLVGGYIAIKARHRIHLLMGLGAGVLLGAVIGAAALVNWRTGLLVALAVIAHDMSDGLNTILLVTHGEQARRRDVLFLVLDALAPVAGGLLALIVLPPARALAVFLGFASGFFLYTATSDLLPEAHRRSPSLTVSVAAIVGIIFIAVAVQIIGR